jgi:hypothetical protein
MINNEENININSVNLPALPEFAIDTKDYLLTLGL